MTQISEGWRHGGRNEGYEPDQFPIHLVENAWPTHDETKHADNSAVLTAERTVQLVIQRWANQAGLLADKPDDFLGRTAPSQGQTVRLLNSAYREEGDLARLAPQGEDPHYGFSRDFDQEDGLQVINLLTAPHSEESVSQASE